MNDSGRAAGRGSGILCDPSVGRICILVLVVLGTAWFALQAWGAVQAYSLDFDEGVYLQTALQHARGQQLYSELFLSQPPLLFELWSLLIRLFGNQVFPARFTSILFGFAVILITLHLARSLFDRKTALLACLLTAINWYLFHEAKVVHTNMPSLALALLALYAALRFNLGRSGWWLVLSACSFALVGTVKLLEVFFIIPILFLLLFPLYKDRISRRFRLLHTWPRTVGLYTMVFAALTAGVYLRYPFSPLVDQVIGLGAAGTLRVTGRARIIIDAYLGWNLGLSLFTILGLYFTFIENRRVFIFFTVLIGAQLFFHALMSEWVWHHHLIVLLPVFSILASAGIVKLVGKLCTAGTGTVQRMPSEKGIPAGRRRALGTVSVVLFILLAVIPNLAGDVYMHREHAGRGAYREEKELVRLIEKLTDHDDLVVSDELMAVFRAGRSTDGRLVDPSAKRIRTGSLQEQALLSLGEEPAMVIFWTGRLRSFQRYHRFVAGHYRLIYQQNKREVYVKKD